MNDIKTPPLLSILVNTYMRRQALELGFDTLIEIADRFTGDLEIVVSDNSSSDGSFEYLEQRCEHSSNITLIRQCENIGAEANAYACWKAARGEFCFWHGDDDLLFVDQLEKLISALKKFQYDLLIAPIKGIREGNALQKYLPSGVSTGGILDLSDNSTAVGDCVMACAFCLGIVYRRAATLPIENEWKKFMNTGYSKWYLAILLIENQEKILLFDTYLGVGNKWDVIEERATPDLFYLERLKVYNWVKSKKIRRSIYSHMLIIAGKGVITGFLKRSKLLILGIYGEIGIKMFYAALVASISVLKERIKKR
jgi:glycosyltransferase involved in cell wall biosynthesis